MTDDRKRRARSIMGDNDRATAGRDLRRVPSYVDPEVTPPPASVPLPESLPGYDTIPPAVATQLESLADGLGTLTSAVGRLWDGRHDNERLRALEMKIEAYTQGAARNEALLNEMVLPFVRKTPGALDALNTSMCALSSSMERLNESLDTLNKTITARIDDLDERLVAVQKQATDTEDRVQRLEEQTLHMRVGVIETAAADKASGDRRELALVRKRRKVFAGVVAAVSTAGGALASWLMGR